MENASLLWRMSFAVNDVCSGYAWHVLLLKQKQSSDFLQEDDITWFCSACRGLAVQAAQTDKLIEDRCKHYTAIALAEIKSVKHELKDDIGTVHTRVSKLSDEVNVLKNEIANIREEQGTGSKNEVENSKNR